MKQPQENRFTDEEMETVRDTDLPDLLTALGYQVKRIGSYHTLKEMDSIRIKNRRTWFRYSEGRGGDAISFLQRFENKSFPEAVEYLLSYHSKARDTPGFPKADQSRKKTVQEEEPPVPFALPPPNGDQRRVFAYLRKRGIAPQVIRGFIQAGLLYEEAEHHNCVFVGRDGAGSPVFASKRGTYDLGGSGFKGGVPGSDKEVAFRLPGDPGNDAVLVFEAPIDLMSYCTLHRNVTRNAVALSCLYDGPLTTYLRENPNIRRIILCLDADGPGRQAAQRMKDAYEAKGYAVTLNYPTQGKDWNEYLQQRGQAQERGR